MTVPNITLSFDAASPLLIQHMDKRMHITYLKTKAKGLVTLWIEHLIIQMFKGSKLPTLDIPPIMSRLTIVTYVVWQKET